MSRVKNNRKKATVDLRVQMSRIKVKMNQPYILLANIPQKKRLPHHQVKTKGVVKWVRAGFCECFLNVKATRGKDNGEGDPETSERREGCSAEGVSHCHFPEIVVSSYA